MAGEPHLGVEELTVVQVIAQGLEDGRSTMVKELAWLLVVGKKTTPEHGFHSEEDGVDAGNGQRHPL